ncbi:DUF4282 domain-containing protein [Mariniluteicoccus flavus]
MSHDQYGQNNPAAGGSNHDPAQGGYGQGYGQQGQAYGSGASNSWGDPMGQRSAGYVDEGAYAQSQGSAPYGQPSAQSQGSASHQWQAQQGQTQQQPAYVASGNQGAPGNPGGDEDSFFRALFDFGFTRYATPTLVKVYYIVGIVIGALYWLGGALMMMVMGSAASVYSSGSGSGGVAAFIWLLFGAPVFFFYVIALRVQLEMMLAMVRTNQDTKVIRARVEQG